MNREKKANQSKANLFKFSNIALVVGFIADSIALISILLALNLPDTSIRLPNFLNPWFAFSIWSIAVYTYLSLLHLYWRKNLSSNQFSSNFNDFLKTDMIIKFRKPLLLSPFLILLITFIWIVIFIPIILVPFSLAFIIFFSISYLIAYRRKVEKLISSRLLHRQWIEVDHLKEIKQVYQYSDSHISARLAAYAFKYPKMAQYGKVYRREDGELITPNNVLVNLEKLSYEKYVPG